jgi:hypothetical protein
VWGRSEERRLSVTRAGHVRLWTCGVHRMPCTMHREKAIPRAPLATNDALASSITVNPCRATYFLFQRPNAPPPPRPPWPFFPRPGHRLEGGALAGRGEFKFTALSPLPAPVVSPDILLHPATYQCTGMYQHSGALLQRQRNELLSVPSVAYQKVNS